VNRHNVLNEVAGIAIGNGGGGGDGGGAAIVGDIEMTQMGGGGGGGGGGQRLKVSNLRKRKQQRRFSAPSSFSSGGDAGRIASLEADNSMLKVQLARMQRQIAALLAATNLSVEEESNHQQQQQQQTLTQDLTQDHRPRLSTEVPSDWDKHRDDKGQRYYSNSTNGTVQWGPPEGATGGSASVASTLNWQENPVQRGMGSEV